MSDSTLKALEAGVGGTDLGAISVMQSTVPVKIGKQTIVDQTGAEVPFAKDASVVAVTTSLGTDGPTPPAIFGSGVRGWLRGIYEKLTGTLTVQGSVNAAIRSLSSVSDSITTVPSGTQSVNGTVTANQGTAGAQAWPVSGPLTDTQLRASSVPVSGPLTDTQLRAAAVPFNFTQVAGAAHSLANPLFASLSVGGTVPSPSNPVWTNLPPSKGITVTGVAAAAATLTVPAPAAGLFNYITAIEIVLINTAARATAAATLITVSSTNLGGEAFSYGSPITTVGTVDRSVVQVFDSPIKADAAATAVTLVAPATTGVQWMLKAKYYQAP